MTQAEGNKLIAEFDGYVYFPNDTLNSIKGVYRKEDRMPMLANHFKYHSSWDWLMPVVEKIFGTITGANAPNIDTTEHRIFSLSIFASINDVWNTSVKFIQWYNNQKSKP
jgi:hypothetical protein